MPETSEECNKFSKRDFKSAKVWLLENNYPLDLIKEINNFSIVDLANMMYNEQNKVNVEALRQDLKDTFRYFKQNDKEIL